MKDKKKLLKIIVAFCLIFVVVCTGFALANVNDIVVDGDILDVYARGTKFVVPEAKLTIGENEYKAYHEVFYPDGRTSTDIRSTLDVIGSYKLVYTANDGASEYKKSFDFTVEDSFSSLFSYGDNVKLVGETSVPSYMSEKYTGSKEGIKFTATENNATIKYNGVIDLAEIGFDVEQLYWYMGREWDHNSDGTRDRVHPVGLARENEFLEFLITPEDNSSKEFETLEIKLTDIHNENNYLRYVVTAGDKKFSQPHQSFCGVTASDMFPVRGYDNLSLGGGANIEATFYGQNGSSWSDSAKLYFDTKSLECVVYPRTADHQTSTMFDKFQDSTVVGLGNEWFGFTTGEVYLEITVKDMLSKECSFMILSVGGHKMDTAPEDEIVITPITGDLDGDGNLYDGDNLPYAVVGANNTYPVFDAVAYHTKGGVLPNVQAKVFYGNNHENVAIQDGKFKTDRVGNYYIEYTVNSAYGSQTKELVVEALSSYLAEDIPDYQLLPETTSVTESGIGDFVTVYDGKEINGIGIWTESIKLEYRATATDSWTEQDIIGGGVRYFYTNAPGEYKLTYTANDSLGTYFTKEHVVNVSYDAIPRMNDVNVPVAFIKGRAISFPTAQTEFISAEGEKAVKVQTFVNSEDYTGRAYTVNGDFTVVYRASLVEDSTKYVEKSYFVKAVDLTEGIPTEGTGQELISAQANAFLSKYFALSDKNEDNVLDFTTSVDKTNLIFSTNTDGATFSFINKIPVELFNVAMSVSQTLSDNCFDSIDVYLTDSVNPMEELKLSIVKIIKNDAKGNPIVYSQFFLNDEMKGAISGSFNGTSVSPFSITYNKSRNFFYDSLGNTLCTPEVYTSGMAFTGFSSGYVYMRVTLSGVTGQTSVKLSEISSQQFNEKTNKDNTAPQLIYSKNMSTSTVTTIGQEQTISSAIGYDVLSEVQNVTMTLLGPSNNKLYEGPISSEYKFTPDKIGKYTIRYSATDTSGKRMPNKSFFIFVQEENAPTLTVNSAPKSTYYVGDELTISGATVTDDTDAECVLTIFIETPTLSQITLSEGDKYKFEKAGTYIVNYYARDKYYNRTCVSYTIQVVEKEG